MQRTDEIIIKASEFEKADAFLEKILNKKRITSYTSNETRLVFDALYRNIMAQGLDPDEEIKLRIEDRFGELKIKIGFEGRKYSIFVNEDDEISPENKILSGYRDKLDSIYHTGYNSFSITARRSYSNNLMQYTIAAVAAIAVYAIILLVSGANELEYLCDRFVYPFETAFANIMLMLAAPVTFFSLLRNLTDIYIVSEKNSNIRKLHLNSILTSAVMVILAIAAGSIVVLFMGRLGWRLTDFIKTLDRTVFIQSINSIIPSNIFAPFEEAAPFPLIIVASLTTYALCSIGAYFDKAKSAIDTCYIIFSRMLTVVMSFLPIFFSLSLLDVMLDGGFADLFRIAAIPLITIACLLIPALYYAGVLTINGVRIKEFARRLLPLQLENLKINSAIDAAEYNIRYCAREYGYDRKTLASNIPILAQINLDGNCFVITLFVVLLCFIGEINLSLTDIFVIGILILFMSMGAPNQPGSLLISSLIIINYLGAYDQLITSVIYAEVLLGGLLNLFNVTGDIVTIAADDARNKKNRTAAEKT